MDTRDARETSEGAGGAGAGGSGTAQRVRVYLSERDARGGRATYLALLELLRREAATGASVWRGLAGFGAPGRLHTATLADLAEPLPLLLEWVDTPERVRRLLPRVCELAGDALVTVDEVRVARWPRRALRDLPPRTRVRDVMTPAAEVDAVVPEASLHDLVLLLLREGRRVAPVVDAGGTVVGIVTNGDLVERAGLPLRLELLAALGDPARPEVAAHLRGLHGDGRTAGDVMTREVVTVGPDVPLAEAARLLLARRLKRLPVVDAEGRLLGLLSRVDVLRSVSGGYPAAPSEGVGGAPTPGAAGGRTDGAGRGGGRERRVGEVLHRRVPTVRPDAPLPEVLDAVVSTRLNRAVVVDDAGRPAGIVVDTDLMQRVTPAAHPGLVQTLMRRVLPGSPAQRQQWQRLTGQRAADVMRPLEELLVVPEDAPIPEVIDRSLARRVKLVAIVDGGGRLVGMVDRADLLAALAPAD